MSEWFLEESETAVGAKLTIPFTVGASKIVGQGNQPELWLLYSTDNAAAAVPNWSDATPKTRGFSVSRGRSTELEQVDAGSSTITLDNRTRTFDPVANALIRPMNRWWLREQFAGETQDLFVGYADSYKQLWPGTVDAVTEVHLTDEFKRLARQRLPVTNPPRDGYADVVKSDTPVTFLRFNDVTLNGDVGPTWSASGAYSIDNSTPIIGDVVGSAESGASGSVSLPSTAFLGAEAVAFAPVTDFGAALTAFSRTTIEFWFKISALPAGTVPDFIAGPQQTTTNTPHWTFNLSTAGIISYVVFDGNPDTNATATSNTAIVPNIWYHVVGTTGLNAGDDLHLYLNSQQVATTAWGTTEGNLNTATFSYIGTGSASGITMAFDEVAYYRDVALPADRVSAHYQAGTQRGFAHDQTLGGRAGAVLDAAASQAPRRIGTGTRNVQGRFMVGQPVVDELRAAEEAENVDAVLFIARDGTVVFLDAAHRASSPYNTVQATFDDDGTDLPYQNLEPDYSDSFIINQWNVTRPGGTVLTATDAVSVDEFGPLDKSLSPPTTTNANAAAIATALLAKYKDPFQRILAITLTTAEPAVAEAVFRRDIGDRIRVFRTSPGGGTRYGQTLFIQSVQIDGQPGAPWVIRWGVSPV